AEGTFLTQAAILNTIQDAYLVYQELISKPETSNHDIQLVHGLMIPIHKKIEIVKMEEKLKNIAAGKENRPFIVVSTQVIEAGVDVSFHQVIRALPIIPSIVQAAGRVNRHGEG